MVGGLSQVRTKNSNVADVMYGNNQLQEFAWSSTLFSYRSITLVYAAIRQISTLVSLTLKGRAERATALTG